MNPQLDPQIVALAKAIRHVESGGNFDARGGSGEIGGYQYTPDTWKGAASKYGINVPLEQATRQQQNEVTYKRLKEWKDSGKNVGQIASMWNAGEGRPNAYKENWKGVNQFGVAYDTPSYARKVATAYQDMKTQMVPAQPTEPEPAKEPFSLGKAAASIVSPLATSIARPFQAAQLGAEMLSQKRENPKLEASSQKYSDESYKLSMQARSMPAGPERDEVMRRAEMYGKMGMESATELSKNASFQPFSTDTLIKPAPTSLNAENMKKEAGIALQTVAFGMGPVSGGAAFGTGMSLEEGNDLLSWDTAAYTLFGAAGGKALDIVGKPLLNAAGSVVGVITPAILKNVALGGAKAVQAFMEHNKLLPNAISKPINRGAELLEAGANAPFNAAVAPFKQTDDKIIATREKALQDLEEKYSQLRDNAARDPKATAATRGRVARSNVLTEEGMVNDDGVIIGAKDAARRYREENIGQGESIVKQLLQKEGVAVDISVVERELKRVMRESLSGRELISALNAVKREIAGLRLANKSGRISLVDLHNAKIQRQPGSKAYDNSETKVVDKQIARAHKQVIEKNSSGKIKEINAEISKYLGDAEYIESLLGKRIGSGKLGKAVSQVGGAVAGAAAGGAIGGLPGVAVGSYVGGSISRKLASRGYRKAFGKPTKQAPKANALFDEARAKINEKQLALPPGPKLGTSGNPIISGPVNRGPGPIATKAPKGEVIRNPKTGKFEKTYLSSSEPLPVQAAKKAIKPGSALESKHMAQIMNNRAKEVIDGKRFGYTSNIDGTEYTGKDAIATLQSKTLKMKDVSPENIAKVIKKNADIYGNNKFVKVGVFKMEDGSGISIDINIATPDRKLAERIAKLNNQESYWDAQIEDVVRTGGTGKQVFGRKDIKRTLDEVEGKKLPERRLYHATNSQFDEFDPGRNPKDFGTWFSSDKASIADPNFPIVKERVLKDNVKLIKEDELDELMNSDENLNDNRPFPAFYLDKGYRGIDYGDGTVQLWKPNEDTIGIVKASYTPKSTVQAKMDKFERAKDLTPEYREIEEKAFRKIAKNEEKLLQDYKKIEETNGGKIINTDVFRKLFKNEGYAGYNAAAVQEPASYLSKKAYTRALKENAGDTVVFTAGGSGVGKSSALKNIDDARSELEGAAVVVDSNMSSLKGAKSKIEEALKAGKKIVYDFVYRDPSDAFENGVVKRMLDNPEEGGRLVPSSVVAGNHIDSLDVAKKLLDEGVPVKFIDNSRGFGNQTYSSYEEIARKAKYPSKEELAEQFNKITKRLYDEGEITKEQYQGFLGE